MTHPRTYRIDKLYNQFLKPKGIGIDRLDALIDRLLAQGFIAIDGRLSVHSTDLERYSETEKLTSMEHKSELFKLIQGVSK